MLAHAVCRIWQPRPETVRGRFSDLMDECTRRGLITVRTD